MQPAFDAMPHREQQQSIRHDTITNKPCRQQSSQCGPFRTILDKPCKPVIHQPISDPR
jgi:hypothetical protein